MRGMSLLMKNSIFRQKSLDKISSPEQLNEYIKVANPSPFIMLAGVLVLLLGVVIWGFFGITEKTETFAATVEDGTIKIYTEADVVKVSEIITVDDTQVEVEEVLQTPVSAGDLDSYLVYVLDVTSDSFLYCSTGSTTLEDGTYSGEVSYLQR